MRRTPTRPWTSLPLLAALTAGLGAQVPVPEPAQVDTQERIPRHYQGSYSESHSRELFRACDRNSDDRLDVLEAADAFPVLRSARDHDGFARLDPNRDGYVTWPEFDARFRKGIENGGVFRVRTCRPYVAPEPPPQPATPLQRFFDLHDRDGDGGLSVDEVQQLLTQLKLPPTLAGPLLQSDLDKSGKVEQAELAPWFASLPIAQLAGGVGKSPLPQPWFDADADHDGRISPEEFRKLLRRLDAGLLRWADALFGRLDGDGDRSLAGDELPTPPAGRRGPGADSSPQR